MKILTVLKTAMAATIGALLLASCASSSRAVLGSLPPAPVEKIISVELITDNINLTEGTIDYIHLGYNPQSPEGDANPTNYVRKAGVQEILTPPQFPKMVWEVHDFNSYVNANNPATNRSPRGEGAGISYTDGLFNGESVSAHGNTQAVSTPDGPFVILVPATATQRRLVLYVGAWNSTLEIEVSDGSGATPEVVSHTHDGGDEDRIRMVNIDFSSDGDGMLVVRLLKAGGENIAIAGYALYDLM